ncbi:hypothetical protein [Flavobacterium selenitireducens]|uniref:hypothetical protein n=1 Tax=Flavobacterium selenitireducens TaxID=2722704 RepID=UPI00168BD4D3|nr:hypothetical protein [Flavobacterium selenitireducens]MBD3582754.1 hypothetical protein [Flavobacterium selenitireducens]
MIYDSLRKLPMVLAIEVMETGNLRLLTDDDSITDEQLFDMWEILFEEFEVKRTGKKAGQSKEFLSNREIEFLERKLSIIKCACDALLFDRNDEMIELLKDYNYVIRDGSYISDIQKVLREADAIKIKISMIRDGLKKETAEPPDIIESMAAITVILGTDFDYYAVSCEKYFALEKAVDKKIKAMTEANKPNNKTKNK